MQILYSPCFNANEKFNYMFGVEKITATYKGISETFNFTNMTDGETIDVFYMQIALELNPIISAIKENGIVKVELINFIDENAPDAEKFPDWIEK